MIEAVLRDRDLSIDTFSSMYEEYPNKMYKAVVANRTSFKTTWDESKLVDPQALQDLIEEQAGSVEGGRAFVRPSGTEDILRLYVEAKNPDDVQRLADAILGAIENDFKDYSPPAQAPAPDAAAAENAAAVDAQTAADSAAAA